MNFKLTKKTIIKRELILKKKKFGHNLDFNGNLSIRNEIIMLKPKKKKEQLKHRGCNIRISFEINEVL